LIFERVGRRTLESNASIHLVIDMRHIISAFIKKKSIHSRQPDGAGNAELMMFARLNPI